MALLFHYPIKETPGTEYKTLEQAQNEILVPLARLIAEAIRQEEELSSAENHDRIGPGQLEKGDDV